MSNGTSGTLLSQLWQPGDLEIDQHQNLYIADTFNTRIVKWSQGATQGELVTGSNFIGNGPSLLNYPYVLYYPSNLRIDLNDQLYVLDKYDARILRFNLSDLSTLPAPLNGTTILSFTDDQCMSMYLNKQTGDIYVCEQSNARIVLWKQGNSRDYVVVAGGNGNGGNQNQFNQPSGVYVDERTLTVYIADTYNNRIQKWLENSTTGITVAGVEDISSGTQQNRLQQPRSGLIVDQEGNLYISDTNNQRIQQWLVNAAEGRTIVGSEDGISGVDSNKLNTPMGIRFDWQYNLYVADSVNNRVQKFNLIDNGC
ncbi:unnamed protein product [Didymodactylos carnosus]|uniref:NHL repeat containing protein n=1 Tax=Didymodactylos carnosus TaxID=1234261 RepID=A0A814FPJ4_9BILA|nr:unnamed protein product [Didymodactylos carnosus]CAF0987769.1 unnamed protein product [Didymodactylos carnosus]CAF3671812.1 unnamed protein product [Didymodactylos carnosus]CAF3759948.1 unnamed protein product [Didymodactylos carnosus]